MRGGVGLGEGKLTQPFEVAALCFDEHVLREHGVAWWLKQQQLKHLGDLPCAINHEGREFLLLCLLGAAICGRQAALGSVGSGLGGRVGGGLTTVRIVRIQSCTHLGEGCCQGYRM